MSTCKNIPAKNPGSNPLFNFEGNDVRVILRDGQPWFVVVDASLALGKTRDSFNTVDILDADEWMVLHKNKAEVSSLVLFNKNAGRLTLVSESGLYKLIMRANPRANPVVARFQNWVTREVLPSLRQDGMYVMGEEKVRTGEMSLEEMTLRVVEGLKAKTERLEVECAKQQKVITAHLMFLPIQVWSGINECYLNKSESAHLAHTAKRLAALEGVIIHKEKRMVPHPYYDEKIESWVNVYPKHILDQAAKSMGLKVVAKFDLIAKVAA